MPQDEPKEIPETKPEGLTTPDPKPEEVEPGSAGEETPAEETPLPTTPAPAAGDEIRRLYEQVSHLQRVVEDLSRPKGDRERESEGEPEGPESPVDQALRSSKLIRRLEKQVADYSERAARAALASKIEVARLKMPQFATRQEEFARWLVKKPGLSDSILEGELSLEEAFAAFQGPGAPKAAARAGPRVPGRPASIPRAEGPSSPGGVVRDIRDIARAKGKTMIRSSGDVWEEAVEESQRERSAASE